MDIRAEKLYHVYNQVNNRNRIFRERNDYLVFLRMVRQKISPKCSIINYYLMPNHYHFLIDATVKSAEKIKLGAIEIGSLSNGFYRYWQYLPEKRV